MVRFRTNAYRVQFQRNFISSRAHKRAISTLIQITKTNSTEPGSCGPIEPSGSDVICVPNEALSPFKGQFQ